MTTSCLVCLGPTDDPTGYHPRCLMTLFGSHRVPIIDVEVAKLHTFALAMVGHTSISGVQRKISLRLPVDRSRLHVAAEHGQYILKPQASSYPSLPENEHVTMLIARRLGVTVPPLGLMRLRDQTLAYLVKRFDRLEDGTKLLQEDFCQLAEKPPKDRYSGSAELCARLVTRYANEPIVEALNLFRLTVCLWWTGNGDMHLKNFSLLRGTDGIYALSPAYDLLCTRLVIKDDLLALSVDGNKKNVTPRQWASFAKACLLPERAAVRVLRATVAAETDARDLIARSYLPTEMKNDYSEQLKKRTKLLAAAVKA